MVLSKNTADYLRYFNGYSEPIRKQIEQLLKSGKLAHYFLKKHPKKHLYQSDKQLYQYANTLKNECLKNAPKLSSVKYEQQKNMVFNALGTHTFKRQQHGKKLKAQHHIAIARQLKHAPESILRALVVHELAHFKEKDHNRNFYNLCCHMEPDYFQFELDLRLFMVMLEMTDNPYISD
jgi:hypothetical protein